MTKKKARDPDLTAVRKRINAQLDEITRIEDMEFVELALTLTDITFSEEMVVEFYLEVSRYVALVKDRYEQAKERLKDKERRHGPS